ncbi:hypothetical protein FRC03_001992 [Tulasnella sp. 419]|nr:hypothetical protein FRC03_001992 [Tulasnella sp. 419]
MAPSNANPKADQPNKRARKDMGGSGSKTKEKLFHPESRKAGQLERKKLRKQKLVVAKSHRTQAQTDRIDRFVFFYHALPLDVPCLTLAEIHELIRDVWVTRHDSAIAAEEAARRKGRPRSVREEKLRALRTAELEEYRTGLEIPDLTDAPTVEMFRKWENAEPGYLPILRLIRVSSTKPDEIIVSSQGFRAKELNNTVEEVDETSMDVEK